MPFTAATFGRKLAVLRADFEQDIDRLAATSGIPAERLRLFESGHEEPTGDEVLILADHFHKDFRFFLLDEASDPDEGVELLFREHGSALSPNDRVAIAEFSYLCRCQAALEQELSVKPKFGAFRFRGVGAYFKRHGIDCANQLRRHLQLGERQVVRDIFSTMRQLGIKVFRRKLENSSISGLFMNHPTAGACILVNHAEGMARQRFSAAHELGHGLMDAQQITLSMIGEWSSEVLIEVRANTFASNFLIPHALLSSVDRASWSDPKVVTHWAERLRVTVPALLSALVGAKLINDELRATLRVQSRRPLDPPDPELEGATTPVQMDRRRQLLERGLSKSYVDLCFEAQNQGVISSGLLAEMLLATPAETDAIASLFGKTVAR